MKPLLKLFAVVVLCGGLFSSYTSEKDFDDSLALAPEVELKGQSWCYVGVPMLYSVPNSSYRADENSWYISGVSNTIGGATDMGVSFTAHYAGWITITGQGYGPQGSVTFTKRIQVINP